MSWMYWTPVTALFFTVIALILVAMTVAQIYHPTSERRGLIPLVTTRGDRMFIGLLSSAYIHLAVLGLTTWPLWWGTVFCVLWIMALLRWG